jgi:hypothetical protein
MGVILTVVPSLWPQNSTIACEILGPNTTLKMEAATSFETFCSVDDGYW